jgi:hypothetical protein
MFSELKTINFAFGSLPEACKQKQFITVTFLLLQESNQRIARHK